jgi:hypothetical protein
MPRVFACIDCGWDIASFGEPHDNDQDICAQCIWLRETKDEAVRAKLREYLRGGSRAPPCG